MDSFKNEEPLLNSLTDNGRKGGYTLEGAFKVTTSAISKTL